MVYVTNQQIPQTTARVVIVSAHGTQILTSLLPVGKALSIAKAENAKLTSGRAAVVNAAGFEMEGVAR